MMKRTTALVGVIATVLLAAAQPDKKETVSPTFKVTVARDLVMDWGGKEKKLEGETTCVYTWKRDGKTRTLEITSYDLRSVIDGKELMNVRMSRAGIVTVMGGQETKLEDATEPFKRTYPFGSPICKQELDANGKETKRSIVAGPGAKDWLSTGVLENCVLFHPWYSAKTEEWQADMEFGGGHGLAKGKATYTKSPGGKVGQAVKVAATLSADRERSEKGYGIVGSKYVVTGQQTYDPVRKEWIDGRLAIEVVFNIGDSARVTGSAKGKMTVKFELVPEKKK